MRLAPALCVACGVCVDKCPEGVMTVESAAVPKPYETKTLFRDQPAAESSHTPSPWFVE